MRTVTLDTGALIALERRKQRMVDISETVRRSGGLMIAPALAVIEWWQGRTDIRERILRAVVVEPVDAARARLMGEAVAKNRASSLVDVAVMTSAASRGDVVFTSDVDDLERLRTFFPAVRVLKV